MFKNKSLCLALLIKVVFLTGIAAIIVACEGDSTPTNYKVIANGVSPSETFEVKNCMNYESTVQCEDRVTGKTIKFGGDYIVIEQ